MFKALVLSSFIVIAAAWANNGHNVLLGKLDSLVTFSYGSLAESDNSELRQAGQEVTNGYFSYRSANK